MNPSTEILTSEINQFQDEIREGYVPEKKTAPHEAFFARIVVCVNACAGMADPSAEIQAMRVAIKEIYAEADAYADGASDASAHDKFCNEIAAKLKPFIKP